MAQRIDLTLGISADTSQAKREIAALKNELSKLGSVDYNFNNNKGIKEGIGTDQILKATQSARELKTMLTSAFNTDTGKLNLTAFTQSLKASGKTLSDYGKELQALGPQGQNAFRDVALSVASATPELTKLNGVAEKLWTTFKNVARYQISTNIYRSLTGALQNAYQYAQDLNKSLTDIRIVTGYSTDKMAQFAVEANSAAQALSQTTNEYTKASLIYFQQGLSDAEVKARTDTTMKMAAVTGQSAQEVSDQMTAVWNNFAKGGENLESYSDKMTALGAATASSSSEIAHGLQQFSAIADTVGLSFDYAAAALTTVTATTRQSADTVGTAFKTLFARLEGLKLGETLDDGTDLTKYSQALATVGVNIKDTNGEIKAMDTIIDELGAKWGTLAKDQQIALAQTVAGMRQYNQLVALMDNFDFFEKNLQTARESEGVLNEQFEAYEEGWEAASNRVRAAWEEIYQKIINSDFFISLLDNLEKFIKGISHVIDGLGGLKGTLGAIGLIATHVFKEQITQNVTAAAGRIKEVWDSVSGKTKKDAQKTQIDALKILEPSSDDTETTIGKNYNQLQKRELDINIELVKNKNALTDSEKQAYQIELLKIAVAKDYYKMLIEQNDELSKQAESLKEGVKFSTTTAKENAKKELEKSNSTKEIQQKVYDVLIAPNMNRQTVSAESLKDATDFTFKSLGENLISEEAILQLQNEQKAKIEEILNSGKTNFEIGKALKDYFQSIAKDMSLAIESAKASIKIPKTEEEYAELEKQFNAAASAGGKLSGILDALDKGTSVSAVTKEVSQLKSDLKDAGFEGENFDINIDDDNIEAKDLKDQLQQVNQSVLNIQRDSSKGLILASDDPKKTAEYLKARGLALSNLGNSNVKSSIVNPEDPNPPEPLPAEKFRKSLGTAAQAGARAVSSFTMLTGVVQQLKDSFSDGELTIQDFVLALNGIVAATQTVSSLGSVAKSLKDIGTSAKASFAALKAAPGASQSLFLLGKGGEAAGAGGIVAQIGLGPLILIIVGIAAVITAVVVGFTLWAKALNAAAIAAENEASAAKQLNEQYQEMKSSYESLKSSLSSYEEAKKGLSELRQGTTEFQEKLIEANDAARDLIDKLDLIYGQDYKIGDNGLIQFNENSIEQANQKQLDLVQQAQAAMIQQNAQAAITAADANKVSVSRSGRSTAEEMAVIGASTAYYNHLLPILLKSFGGVGPSTQTEIANREDIVASVIDKLASGSLAEIFKTGAVTDEQILQLLQGQGLKATLDNDSALIASIRQAAGQIQEANSIQKTANKEIVGIKFGSQLTGDKNADAKLEALGDAYGRIATQLESGYKERLTNGDQSLFYQFAAQQGWKASEISDLNIKDDETTFSLNGEKKSYNTEAIVAALASAEALGEASQRALNTINDILGSNAVSDAAKAYFTGINNADKSTLESDITGITDDQAKALGYNSINELLDEIKKAQSEALKVLDVNSEDWASQMTNTPREVLKTFYEGLTEAAQDEFSASAMSELQVIFQKTFTNFGQDGLLKLQDVLKGLGIESDDYAEILANLDWDNVSIEDYNKALSNAGLEVNDLSTKLFQFALAAKEASNEINNFASFSNIYKQLNDYQNKLKDNNFILSSEDFNGLTALNKGFSQLFDKMLDGTYILRGTQTELEKAFGQVRSGKIMQYMQSLLNKQDIYEKNKNFNYNNAIQKIEFSEQQENNTSKAQTAPPPDIPVGNAIKNPPSVAAVSDHRLDAMQGIAYTNSSQAPGAAVNQGTPIPHQREEFYASKITDRDQLDQAQASINYLSAIKEYQDKVAQWQSDLNNENLTVKMYDDIASAVEEAGNRLNQFKNDSEDAAKELQELLDAQDAQSFADAINEFELDPTEAQELSDAFKETYDELAETNKGLKNTQESADDAAVRYMRLNRGVKDLYNSYDDYVKVLKELNNTANKTEKIEIANSETGKKLKKTLSDILDTSEDFIDVDFMQSINLEDLEEAAMGSEDAIGRIRNSFIENSNIMQEALSTAGVSVQELENYLGGLEEGAVIDLDTAPFIKKLADALTAANYTGPQIQSIFSALGLDFDIEPFTQSLDEAQIASNEFVAGASIDTEAVNVSSENEDTAEYQDVEATLTPVEAESSWRVAHNQGEEEIAKLHAASFGVSFERKAPQKVEENKTENTTAYKFSNGKVSAGGNVSQRNKTITPPGSSGGSGGGGGGGSAKKPKAKKADGKNRYHEVNKRLELNKDTQEDLSKTLSKLETQTQRTFGPSSVALIGKQIEVLQQENDVYDKQIELLKQRKAEAEAHRPEDAANLVAAGAKLGVSVEIDEEGVIKDYEAIMQKAMDYYNANVTGDSDADEQLNEDYEAFEKLASLYEDTMKVIMDTDNELEEAVEKKAEKLRAIFDQKLSMIQISVEYKLEITENVKSYYDYIDARTDDWIDSLEKVEAVSAQVARQQEFIAKNTADVKDAMEETLTLGEVDSGLISEFMNKIDKREDYTEAYQKIADSLQNAADPINGKELLEQLNGYISQMLGYWQDAFDQESRMFDAQVALSEKMREQLDKQYDKIVDRYEDISNKLDVFDGIGAGFSQASANVINQYRDEQIEIIREERDFLDQIIQQNQQEKENLEKQREQLIKERDQTTSEAHKAELNIEIGKVMEQIETISDAIDDKMDERRAKIGELADLVRERFSIAVNNIVANFDKAIAGSFGNLEALSKAYDQKQQLQEQYIPEYKQVYELNKINRDIAKQIESTDNLSAQKKLRDFQKEIYDLQNSGKKLSDYDLEYLQKKYDLRVAEIALEDAQNQKNMVRLSRDAEGNYSYVYTADESAESDAAGNYEDKLYAMQELNQESLKNNASEYLSLLQEQSDALRALGEMDLTPAEFQKQQEQIVEYYAQRGAFLSEQNEAILNNNKALYDEDYAAFEGYSGMISEGAEAFRMTQADFVSEFQETTLGQLLDGYESMSDHASSVLTALSGAENSAMQQIAGAYVQFAASMEEIYDMLGEQYNPYEQRVQTGEEKIRSFIGATKDEYDSYKQTAENSLTAIGDAMGKNTNRIYTELKASGGVDEMVGGTGTAFKDVFGEDGTIREAIAAVPGAIKANIVGTGEDTINGLLGSIGTAATGTGTSIQEMVNAVAGGADGTSSYLSTLKEGFSTNLGEIRTAMVATDAENGDSTTFQGVFIKVGKELSGTLKNPLDTELTDVENALTGKADWIGGAYLTDKLSPNFDSLGDWIKKTDAGGGTYKITDALGELAGAAEGVFGGIATWLTSDEKDGGKQGFADALGTYAATYSGTEFETKLDHYRTQAISAFGKLSSSTGIGLDSTSYKDWATAVGRYSGSSLSTFASDVWNSIDDAPGKFKGLYDSDTGIGENSTYYDDWNTAVQDWMKPLTALTEAIDQWEKAKKPVNMPTTEGSIDTTSDRNQLQWLKDLLDELAKDKYKTFTVASKSGTINTESEQDALNNYKKAWDDSHALGAIQFPDVEDYDTNKKKLDDLKTLLEGLKGDWVIKAKVEYETTYTETGSGSSLVDKLGYSRSVGTAAADLMLKSSGKLLTLGIANKTLDINGDGKFNSNDATMMLRMSNGYTTTLGGIAYTDDQFAKAKAVIDAIQNTKYKITFATGGYTGEWGDSGKLAVLHEKELVLNKTDTSNILQAVDMIRQLADSIDLSAKIEQATIGARFAFNMPKFDLPNQELNQNVTIYADFPGVSVEAEIQQAFNSMEMSALQYANQNY